jgi:hypothetical protein
MFREIKLKDRLILKAVVCCLFRDRTISGKVDAVISWSVMLYRSCIGLFFYVPHLIRTEEDLERVLEELSRHDILEYIRQQRPDTKWVVHLLTNVTFYLNKLIQHPISTQPGNPWKPSVCIAGTGGNMFWLELPRWSLDLHDVRPGIGKSIGFPHQTDGFQGFPGCVLRRPDGLTAVVQLERVCLRPPRDGRGRYCSTIGTTFSLQLPGDHEFELV